MNEKIGYLMPHPPIIIPEVGKGDEEKAAKTIGAMEKIAKEIEMLHPETIVLISPHAPLFSDYFFMYDSKVLEGDFTQFGSNLKLEFTEDSELLSEIEKIMKENQIQGGRLDDSIMKRFNLTEKLDHGALVPLYYLRKYHKNFKLVVMSLSGYDLQYSYKVGQLIWEAADKLGRNIVIIASGDMSHKVNDNSPYGAVEEGSIFDHMIAENIKNNHLRGIFTIDHEIREKAGECGYKSLAILCGAFDKQKIKTELLSYEAPFGIGYCVAKVESIHEADFSMLDALKNEKIDISDPVRIAKETLENYINGEKTNSVDFYQHLGFDEKLFRDKAGVFVSLKKFGELRGCIGTTEATASSVAEEIMQNAVNAGTHDPRFAPVEPFELPYITYSVDVLDPPSFVQSKEELNTKKYGVIVSHGHKRGLLLPDLEGVETVGDQLEIACRKANIDPKGQYDIEKFTITRYR